MSLQKLVAITAQAGGLPEVADLYQEHLTNGDWARLLTSPHLDLAVRAATVLVAGSAQLHPLTKDVPVDRLPEPVQVVLVSTPEGLNEFAPRVTAPTAVAAVVDAVVDADADTSPWQVARYMRQPTVEVLRRAGLGARLADRLAGTSGSADPDVVEHRVRLLELAGMWADRCGEDAAVFQTLPVEDLVACADRLAGPARKFAVEALIVACDAGRDVAVPLAGLAQDMDKGEVRRRLAEWLLARVVWPGGRDLEPVWERVVAPYRPAAWWAELPLRQVKALTEDAESLRLGNEALLALLGRRDVSTKLAQTLVTAASGHREEWVRARAFDGAFVRWLVKKHPSLLGHVGNPALVREVLVNASSDGVDRYLFAGRQMSDRELLALPWRVLGRWAELEARPAKLVAQVTAPLLASETGRVALAHVLGLPVSDPRVKRDPAADLLRAVFAAAGEPLPDVLA